MKKLVCVLSIVSITGCSSFSAFQGTPDIASLRVGMLKGEVEDIVDNVSTIKPLTNGQRQVTYSYTEKDSSIFRGVGYFIGDLLSFFLLEPLFWLLELERGNKNYAVIVYDRNGRVVSFTTSHIAPPPSQ